VWLGGGGSMSGVGTLKISGAVKPMQQNLVLSNFLLLCQGQILVLANELHNQMIFRYVQAPRPADAQNPSFKNPKNVLGNRYIFLGGS
jgi:hypothetical protein